LNKRYEFLKRRYLKNKQEQIHIYEIEASEAERHYPILCLHPAPYSGLFFKAIMPMINQHRKVIAPDYPGYGGSSPIESPPSISDYAAAINNVLDQIGDYDQYELIGFHTGCLVANELCLLDPKKINHTIMIDIPYFSGDAQKRLYNQMSKPLDLTKDLESLKKAWDFNVKNRIGKTPMERSFELFIESLRPGIKDYFAFHAAFTYQCEEKFQSNSKHVNVLATRSGLLDATHAAAETLNKSEIRDIHDISSNVFEEGATIIAEHVMEILSSD